MRLAPDAIEISFGDISIELRPSLRAALRLARRYNGFAPLFRGVLDGNLTLIADVIREASNEPSAIPELLREVGLKGLGITLTQLTAPLIEFVMALTGQDNDQPAAPTSNPITFATYFEGLFQTATGALGWHPEIAWASTPAEIHAAYEGRSSLLRALFGSAAPNVADAIEHTRDPNAKLDREALNVLKAKIAR